jgi:nicotinamidase-related amidase
MLRIESWDTCAFLFIDLQPVFTDRFNETAFVGQTEDALAFARTALPPSRIVHIRANYSGTKMVPYSRVLNPQLPYPSETSAASWATEQSDEPVIIKPTVNGFHETSLEEYLTSQGVDTIIICGLLTCCCVHETAIGGMVRGFKPVLVEDACIDKNREKHDATIMLYKDYMYQTCLLADLKTRFAQEG